MPNIPFFDLSGMDKADVVHIFFLLDASGSMRNEPIQTLNEAMANVLPHIQKVADSRDITPLVHILAFNSGVHWLCGTTATHGVPAKDIRWDDISVSGTTDTASAIHAIREGLRQNYLGNKGYRPIIVLITDGCSDDRTKTLEAFAALDGWQKTIRIAVGVKNYNSREVEAFATEARVDVIDDMEEVITSQDQKLVFPVARTKDLANVIRTITLSGLKSSILIGKDKAIVPPTDDEDEMPVIVTMTQEEKARWF